MAIATTTILAAAALSAAAYGAHQAVQGRKEASRNAARAAQEDTKARNEQKAMNTSQAAAERRAQIREERVRRAKILQAAENTGSAGSSGEYGAIAGMGTQLQSNIGMNLGRLQSTNLINGYVQNAADFNTAAQRAANSAQNGQELFSLGMSIFSASGGFSAFKKA